jgi:polyhydroxyalkanoate synthesis repressor PhaR
MRVIKRYNNRKLYDTDSRTYVTLEGLAKLITDGFEIQVVDNDTDEDITTVILSQILLERERVERFLPSNMLSGLLRLGGATGRKLGSTLTRPFTFPLALLEQEIERSFKIWMDMAQDREEDMLRLMERLIEQRRRARQNHSSETRDTTRKLNRSTHRLDNFEEMEPD